jgi:hypothetical protein
MSVGKSAAKPLRLGGPTFETKQDPRTLWSTMSGMDLPQLTIPAFRTLSDYRHGQTSEDKVHAGDRKGLLARQPGIAVFGLDAPCSTARSRTTCPG